LSILLIQPLRRYDLAHIDIGKHPRRDRRGRIHRLVIQTHKTRREIDAEIPPELASRIERHLTTFRPLLPGADASTALFPGEGGGSRQPDVLGRQITKLVARQLGAKFSPHLVRHLVVEMLMDADTRNMVVAQRLLGHGTLSPTQQMYGITRTSAAQKQYLDLVQRLRDKPTAPRRPDR
jgi:integrase